jgi:hypothetical protein
MNEENTTVEINGIRLSRDETNIIFNVLSHYYSYFGKQSPANDVFSQPMINYYQRHISNVLHIFSTIGNPGSYPIKCIPCIGCGVDPKIIKIPIKNIGCANYFKYQTIVACSDCIRRISVQAEAPEIDLFFVDQQSYLTNTLWNILR